MTLTPRQLELLLWCAGDVLHRRQRGEFPGVQPWNLEVIRALKAEIDAARSNSGSDSECSEPEWESGTQWSARQAAEFLGCSGRQVRYLAKAQRLRGENVDNRWIFNENDVRAYKGDEPTTDGQRRAS